MGKLNIAHHKSYHPYRRDNIEKVKRDEEEAREKEEREEGRMRLADSEARIDRLRNKAGVSSISSGSSHTDKKNKKKRRDNDDELELAPAAGNPLPTTSGHINLFEDLEHVAIAASLVKKPVDPTAETEKGFPLAPPTKDLKPWYTARTDEREEMHLAEIQDEKRRRDTARKSIHDPLTAITRQLASSSTSRPIQAPKYRHLPIALTDSSAPPEVQARLTRENLERERAAELRRRKGVLRNETPTRDGGYTDLFNRREVEDARREREHRPNAWDDRSRKDRGNWRR